MTSLHLPSTPQELELYRVLQKANLLQYYNTFISQGGDDVAQLCDAGEEEFLEIMALVGMASKPLHVRRLQKEWLRAPQYFKTPLPSSDPLPEQSVRSSSSPIAGLNSPRNSPISLQTPTWCVETSTTNLSPNITPPQLQQAASRVGSPGATAQRASPSSGSERGQSSPVARPSPASSPASQEAADNFSPVLTGCQVKAINTAADLYAATMPVYEAKQMTAKKHILREIEEVLTMEVDRPQRMELIRKYSAIYGRFDSKRKNDKVMTLHEVSVNEAAARLCHHQPTLLTRREDLFPLARSVVRNSGYQYSKGHSRSLPTPTDVAGVKRPKEANFQQEKVAMEDRLTLVREQLRSVSLEHEDVRARLAQSRDDERAQLTLALTAVAQRHTALLVEQSDLNQKLKKYSKETTESPSNQLESPPTCPDLTIANLLQNGQVKKQFMHNTLFEEGMRIAKQFGFSELESEIKFMKKGDDAFKTAEDEVKLFDCEIADGVVKTEHS